jgi:hypothetical protein
MTDQIIYNTPTLVLPYSQEHWDLSQSFNIIKDDNNWLEDALPLDIYNSNSKRLRGLIDSIFTEVELIIPIHSRHRYKEVLKMVIINLWHAHFLGKPIMYSRDTAYYSRNSRYGKLFIKYDRLIPVIDTLETLGYIQQKCGFWDDKKKLGRITRMWSTFKLWKQFRVYNLNQHGFYSIARTENVIILRDGEKHNKEMNFVMNPDIRCLVDDLEHYNKFVEEHNITVNLNKEVQITTEFLSNTLHKSLLKHTIEVELLKLSTRIGNPYSTNNIHRPLIQQFSSDSLYTTITTNQHIIPYHTLYNTTTMTQRFLPDYMIYFGFRDVDKSLDMLTNYLTDLSLSISMDPKRERQKERLKEKYPLGDIGIDRLVLRLVYEYIHRVFNRKSFKLGGRGYGAIHQRLPKNLRPYIHINGQPTVESDYSAYHIRMLYHMEGIDYSDDPYLVCEGPEMRATYKAVGLVAINAENVGKAYGGIFNELKSRGIPLPAGEKPITRLVNRFKDAHPRIAKYICADMGVHLMNIDSRIMNNILMKLMDRGILGLSVFDSVIVAEHHQDFLREIMVEEYEKVMGFEPIID